MPGRVTILDEPDATRKTHTTAVVLIPPKDVWEPIQRIRRVHDRHISRWMPHVTLLYPFRPRCEFAQAFPKVEAACARVESFTCTLAGFLYFEHTASYTMWLAPEPAEPLAALHQELVREFPDCDETTRFEGGFTPHLSVGQARERTELDRLLGDLEAAWEPVEFTAREVAMIWRGRETRDVFTTWRTAELGGAPCP
jgi:2'-5' RNA ligase